MNHLLPNKNKAVVLWIALFVVLNTSSKGARHSLFTDKSSVQSLSVTGDTSRPSQFKNTRRSRRVHLAPIVASGNILAPGDELALNLFDDAAYTARIDRIHTNINGTVSIRARVDNSPMGYLLLSTTDNQSMGSISLPDKALQYCIQNDPATGTHYLYEMNADGIEELPDSVPLTRPETLSMETEEIKTLDEAVSEDPLAAANIDVMIVYTPAAMSWAGGASGIVNVIAQAMERAQLALDDSDTFVTMTLVHSAQVDYTESGSSSTDLNRLTFTTDGYMDQVHSWRYTYKADLVGFFAKVDDTGGLGWGLNLTSGEPGYGFSLSRVQQVGWTYTLIHELGHNMGCDHRKDQVDQHGPGLFSYSAGWRWIGANNGKYCSVMSYEEDGYGRVGYFSNPNVLYQGVATGDAADGDNARTIRDVKHVIAAYREPTGSLKVNLSPQDAVDAGAQWRRVGTTVWYNSDSAEPYIPIGNYSVEFKNTSGWARPADKPVSISENQLTETACVYNEAPEFIIGTGVSAWGLPLATWYHDARTQTIYPASEIGAARHIIALGLYVTEVPAQAMDNFTIRLKHTDLSVYDSLPSWESSDWTTVYQVTESVTEPGWVLFYFTAPFIYNGIQNLMVDISFNNSAYSTDGTCQYSSPGGTRTLYYRTDSYYGDPLTWAVRSPIPAVSTRVPNIKLVTTKIDCQIGDLNETCGVDWEDLGLFSLHWQQTDCSSPNWCSRADLNQSGNVDLTDFSILALNWLQGNIQYRPYDIVPDGQINMEDLTVLIEQWLDVPASPSADIAPQPLDNVVNIEDFALLAAHWLEGV